MLSAPLVNTMKKAIFILALLAFAASGDMVNVFYNLSAVTWTGGPTNWMARFGSGFPSGLVAHWKMDELSWNGTSGEVVDSVGVNSGISVNGANTGTDSVRSGRVGVFGLQSGSRVEITGGSAIKPTDAMTVACWVNFVSVNGNTRFFCDWHQGSSTDRWLFWTPDATHVGFYICNSNESSAANLSFSNVPTGQWIHLMGTFNGSVAVFYTNGAFCAESALVGSLNAGTSELLNFGMQSGVGNYLDGKLDDAMIFNRALTADEVNTVYNMTKSNN